MEIKYASHKKGRDAYKSWGIPDSYIYYKEETPKNMRVDKKVYKALLKDFFWELSKMIIQERYNFKVPLRLGFISIKKRKNYKESCSNKIDYKLYNKEKKIVHLFNRHTDRFYFFWAWDKKKFNYAFFKNKPFYKFIPNRGNDRVIGKRGLAAWIMKTVNDPKLKDYDVLE